MMEKTPEKMKKTSKWFIIWLLSMLIVLVGILFLGDHSRNFLKRIQIKHQEEITKVIAEQRNIFNNQSQELTKGRLTDTILKLQPKLDKIMASRISESILLECKTKCLDPALVVGLIKVESEFNPFAESAKGATGLMQIRYSVWKEEPELTDNGVNQKAALFWIDRNVKAGTGILKKYYEEANCDMIEALYRYNSGIVKIPKDVSRWDMRYVNKVIYYTYMVKTHLTDDNKCEAEAGIKEIKEKGEKS